MPKFDVTFTEIVVYTIQVEAKDEDKAFEKADKLASNFYKEFDDVCEMWDVEPSDAYIEEVTDE